MLLIELYKILGFHRNLIINFIVIYIDGVFMSVVYFLEFSMTTPQACPCHARGFRSLYNN